MERVRPAGQNTFMASGSRVLPSGTVTFLFTDIERSTESAAALGDERWADALQIHRDLLRPVFERHGGVEVGTEGDSFFVAFVRAGEAVSAAADGQRVLESHRWQGESRLRVRMGLHTGEALVRGTDYVGHEVHRAKRISDAAHGGQIVLSQTTAELVGPISLLDLGSHRLKDLGEPQHLFQLIADGLPVDFPPLRSLDTFTHSLPLQRSAFIGRDDEINEIRRLLLTNRIVTLTGVGGCGKTRLAQQVGAEELENFPDGVFFVNLAPISDPDQIVREVAMSAGAPVGGALSALTGTGAGPLDETMLGHLGSRTSLIIIDNCEHLIDACAGVVDKILARATNVKVLATSREGLRIDGEQAWTVPSLSLPDERDDPAASEAVSLFKARAGAVRSGFDLTPENIGAVVEICRRLDGIPLAIEFAAARVSHLSPRQIADRLDDRFRLLTGGQRRVQRQHTLQTTLDWSYDLLDESERALLRRLSVFAGDFGIDAAEAVTAGGELEAWGVTDVLGSLVSKSLVEADDTGAEVRYRLLETVRAYAAERLAHAGEAETYRSRHRDWYDHWLHVRPWIETWANPEHAQRLWAEESNITAAIEWSIAQNDPVRVARLATRARTGWTTISPSQYEGWITFALQAEDELDPDDRVLCLASAWNALSQGLAQYVDFAERTVAAAGPASPPVAAFAWAHRALARGVVAAMTRNDDLAALSYEDFDKAMEFVDNPVSRLWAMFQRIIIDLSLARIDAAAEALEEGVRLCEQIGNLVLAGGFAWYASIVAHVLGARDKERSFGDYAARTMDLLYQTDGVASVAAVRAPMFVAAGTAAISPDEPEVVWELLRELRPRVLRSGVPAYEAGLVLACAIRWTLDGDYPRAARLLSWVRTRTMAAGAIPSPGDYVLYLHYRDLVRAALGPEASRLARNDGALMSLEDALALAFERTSAST